MYARILLIATTSNVALSFLQSYFFTKTEQSELVTNFISTAHPVAVIIFFFCIIVIIPICEELAFRQLLWKICSYIASPKITATIVAIAFALAHSYPSFIFLIPISFYLSYLRYTTDSIKAGIFFHIAFNGTGMLVPYVWS